MDSYHDVEIKPSIMNQFLQRHQLMFDHIRFRDH